MPQITVDGQRLEVPEGTTLLQALDDLGLLMNGVDVPHYCWHPKLSVDGSCRLCQVEIEGVAKLQIACDTPVAEGMVVHTKSERVQQAREGVMELLLVNHPLDCPICDQAGECKLQDFAVDYGLEHARTREPRRPGRKRVELGPTIVFDEERCILCRRCVRFCREVPGTGELIVENRGDRSTISTFPDMPLDNPYSMNVADVCPVGALTTRDFRFKVRVWDLEEVPGLCTGCSKGCNVHVGVARGAVQRYTPRRNDAVNETWMCDLGRLSYKSIGAPDRIDRPAVRDATGQLVPASMAEAIGRAADEIRTAVRRDGPGVVAALASPHATNEDLAALRLLLESLGTATRGAAVICGEPDGLLLQPERAANARGARDLGFGDPTLVFEKIRGGGARVLLVMGHDLLAEPFLGGIEALRALDAVILLDTHRSALERVATVVVPGRVLAEKGGSMTNHAGIVQQVPAALEPAFEAHAEGSVLGRLRAALQAADEEGAA